ncbi:choline dehydrogenase-like flavoprotein [Sphingomonas kyeonggiensis]|uniref:GMC family oxidoreductase n=1 Tax=Sphingomonas kyeonggiensis TaxID=1268553 RepID=UPI002781C056|nr:GMC family oxidoreductase [Sphingomonas kyeonggiensis]MDQ0251014.1 choline dehydrogenase-like flavoprotein [Sphingomonas kyeonggiensis]
MSAGAPDHDVAIIGAGVAGAMIAARLARKGLSVLLLDAGPELGDRLAAVGRFAASATRLPHDPYRNVAADTFAPSPRVNDPPQTGHYLQETPTTPFKSTYQRTLGGSTLHFLGNVPRFLPADFEMRTRHGIADDWPFGYDVLEPWYCEAEAEMGAAGDHDEWDGLGGGRRSHPFPMPPIWPSHGDKVVRARLDGKIIDDVPVRIRITPQARNSIPYQGRPPCAGNSSCVPTCPIQAKYDATVHVDMARAAGCDVRPRAVVHRLDHDADARVTELHYHRWSEDGTGRVPERASARVFVVAAHAIETPLILINSGIAPDSPVGGCLMDHLQGYGMALMPEPVFPYRGPPVITGIDAWRDGSWRGDHAAFRISIGNDGWGRPEPLDKTVTDLVATGLWGAELRSAIGARATHMIRLSYSTEMLPDPTNRVTLAAGGEPDRLRPAIHFSLPDYNSRAFDTGNRLFAAMFAAMGARDARFTWPDSNYSGAGHIVGTTRMGTDPRTSVCDADGRVHGAQNLYIAGASVFPTSGTANPTLTLAALALRLADHLAARLKGME